MIINIMLAIMFILAAVLQSIWVVRWFRAGKPAAKRKILMAAAAVFLVLFAAHTVWTYVELKAYEASLIKLRELGVPVTLEEIVMKAKNRSLSPEENAAELLKGYDIWANGTEWKGVQKRKSVWPDSVADTKEQAAILKYLKDRKLSDKNRSLLKSYIAKNKVMTDLVGEIAGCKGYYLERDLKNPVGFEIPDLLLTRTIFEAADIKIDLEYSEGNVESAVCDLEKYYRANKVLNLWDGVSLIETMIGTVAGAIYQDTIRNIATRGSLSGDQSKRLQFIIEENEKVLRDSFSATVNAERAFDQTYMDPSSHVLVLKILDANTFAGLARKGYCFLYYSYIYRPLNLEERAFGNRYYALLLEGSKKNVYDKKIDDGLVRMKTPKHYFFSKFFLSDMRPTWLALFLEANRLRQTGIILRLEDYKKIHGAYPDSLSGLAKISGRPIPADIMTGTEFNYSVKEGKYQLESDYNKAHNK